MARHNCFDGKGIHVMAERCKTCIFEPGNRMHLEPGRVKEMVETAKANDSTIVCHSTLDKKQNAVCRGFFDRHATTPLQLAERLGFIIDHEIPED